MRDKPTNKKRQRVKPRKMAVTPDVVSETVSLGPRPCFQQKSFYTRLEVAAHRRHKEQVTIQPTMAPVKYADTLFLIVNNTRRRFLHKTFYEPRMRPMRFAETTYAAPKTTEEVNVSRLDHHADECKRWFKTSLQLKPKNFTSSCDFVPISGSGSGLSINGLLDENMNNRIPQIDREERYDPGASQVFIPKPSPATRKDDVSQIEGQILVDFLGNHVDYLQLNGQTNEFSDL